MLCTLTNWVSIFCSQCVHDMMHLMIISYTSNPSVGICVYTLVKTKQIEVAILFAKDLL